MVITDLSCLLEMWSDPPQLLSHGLAGDPGPSEPFVKTFIEVLPTAVTRYAVCSDGGFCRGIKHDFVELRLGCSLTFSWHLSFESPQPIHGSFAHCSKRICTAQTLRSCVGTF